MELKWVLQPANNSEDVDQLASQLNVPGIIANILLHKGIDTEDDIGEVSFFLSQTQRREKISYCLKNLRKCSILLENWFFDPPVTALRQIRQAHLSAQRDE